MRAYTVLKGKHNTEDKTMWINNIISYNPFKAHYIEQKTKAKDFSGYGLKKLKKYANDNIIFIRKSN